MLDSRKAVASIQNQRRAAWKTVRAILVPFVALSVPLVVLLVLEFRSLSRFEAVIAETLRRSTVHTSEELSRRIANAARNIGEAQQTRGDATFTGKPPSAERDDAIWLTPVAPAASWSELGSPGGTAVSDVTGGGGNGDRETTAAEVHPPGTTGEASEWHPTLGSFAVVRAGHSPIYFGLAPESDLAPSPGSVDGDAEAPLPPVYAVTRQQLVASDLPRLLAEMRDERRSLEGAPPLELAVMDDRGIDIYRTGPSLANSWVHEVRFPFLVSSPEAIRHLMTVTAETPMWRVRAGYPGTTIEDLARSETNRQRQLLVWVAVVAGVGIVLSVRATAREVKLAEMKSEFISSVSHDLKTPLASIRVFAETLASRRAKSEHKVWQYGKMIGLEVGRLDQMINDILDFNTIEAGDREYRIEEVELREVVDEIVEYFGPQLREANFEIDLDLPAVEVRFLGNREGLLQMLGNLVSNALKFRNQEPGSAGNHLEIRLAEVDDNAVIEVADRGIGIPPGDRRKVFEKFYRVIREPDTDAAGTGLGLAIVAHVVSAHGGRVTVEGNHDGGSTFRIELPLYFS